MKYWYMAFHYIKDIFIDVKLIFSTYVFNCGNGAKLFFHGTESHSSSFILKAVNLSRQWSTVISLPMSAKLMEFTNSNMSTKNDSDKRKRTSENIACMSCLVFINNGCIYLHGIKTRFKNIPLEKPPNLWAQQECFTFGITSLAYLST